MPRCLLHYAWRPAQREHNKVVTLVHHGGLGAMMAGKRPVLGPIGPIAQRGPGNRRRPQPRRLCRIGPQSDRADGACDGEGRRHGPAPPLPRAPSSTCQTKWQRGCLSSISMPGRLAQGAERELICLLPATGTRLASRRSRTTGLQSRSTRPNTAPQEPIWNLIRRHSRCGPIKHLL